MSKGKGMFLYSAVSSLRDCSKRFTTRLHPGRPDHSNPNSTLHFTLADLLIPTPTPLYTSPWQTCSFQRQLHSTLHPGRPAHSNANSTLHFTLADLLIPTPTPLYTSPWQTCSFQRQLDFCGKHSASLQLLFEDCSFTCPPLSIARTCTHYTVG